MAAFLERLLHRRQAQGHPQADRGQADHSRQIADEEDYTSYEAACPGCGGQLTDVRWRRDLPEFVADSLTCPHCHEEVSYSRSNAGRLTLWLKTSHPGEELPPPSDGTVSNSSMAAPGSDPGAGPAKPVDAPRDVPELIELLADPNPKVRADAVEALGASGDQRAIQPLIAALADDDPEVATDAAFALPLLGEAAVGPVIAALTDPNSGVPSEAFRGWGVTESDVAQLSDENPEVRHEAEALFRALVNFSSPHEQAVAPSPRTPVPANIDELFELIVEPWKASNLTGAEPDWAGLADAVAPYPATWRAVAWQDVGRSQWQLGGAYPRAAGDWRPIAQCYVEALRHNSAPDFLGWDVFTGADPTDDPQAEALKRRIRGRTGLSDADRAQLVNDLRQHVGAPGDAGTTSQ